MCVRTKQPHGHCEGEGIVTKPDLAVIGLSALVSYTFLWCPGECPDGEKEENECGYSSYL